VAVLLLLTTVVLVALGVTELDAYFTAYVLETLVITELYGYFNTRARRGLYTISVVLFLGFSLIVMTRVARIILG
jgi:uncharacterized membrane protein